VLLDDLAEYDIGTIRLFVPALRKVADEQVTEVFAEGPENIMLKPEFFDRDRVHAIVEMLRDRSLLVHVLRADSMKRGNVVITIGRENKSEPFGLFSVVKSDFRVGNLCGTLGVVGPTRMPYGYLASAVEYTAELLDKMYS
jgi:heat-inducible transcriptional repressor